MRCIFSDSLNESTLYASPGTPLIPSAGIEQSRARFLTLKDCLRPVVDTVVTTLFPADCRACGGPLARASSVPICNVCRSRVTPQTMTMCFRCGEALDMESARFASQFPAEGLLCHVCRLAPPLFERAVAYAVYEGELREMVHLLKYERMRPVAKVLGKMLAMAIIRLESQASHELIVVPVPLFPSKLRQRSYNQSEVLADAAISELRGLRPHWRLRKLPLLARRRDTRSQFELNPRSRRRNLQGAFAVAGESFPLGCEVLLIDDIYTTGATARECARVLRRAGAQKVWVATLARAQTPRVALWDDASLSAPRGFG